MDFRSPGVGSIFSSAGTALFRPLLLGFVQVIVLNMPRLSRPHSQFSWLKLLGILCIALVAISGVVQAAHTHPAGQPEHDCAICVSAHQAVQIVAVPLLTVFVEPVAFLAAECFTRPPANRFSFKLFSRPPPAVSLSV
jgi:hypothetical protein